MTSPFISPDEFYESLSPKIRKLVRQLHDWGYLTTDSGDGTNAQEGMECAVPWPMVVIQLSDWARPMEKEAIALWDLLEGAGVPMDEPTETGTRKVEATYEVGGPRLLLVLHVTDGDLEAEEPGEQIPDEAMRSL